jgi:hypothetical protein
MKQMKLSIITICLFFVGIIQSKSTPETYICTAANAAYFKRLINLIGSLHASQFDEIAEIAVYDLGLLEDQKKILRSIAKVVVLPLNPENPDVLKPIFIPASKTHPEWPYQNSKILGAYAWKPVVFKRALQRWKDKPIIWLDAGTTVHKSLRPLVEHIKNVGYFLCTPDYGTLPVRWGTTQTVIQRLNLEHETKSWILNKPFAMAGVVGFSYKVSDCLINPLYECTKDLSWFIDNGSTPDGYGSGRYEQTLLSIFAYLAGLAIITQNHTQATPIMLSTENGVRPFYITWVDKMVNAHTCIFSSRNTMPHYERFAKAIRKKG